MANKKFKSNKNKGKEVVKRERIKFKSVDVWQSSFGPVSVNAVYDVFETTFNIEKENMRKYSFQECVESLRKFENPNYKTNINVSNI